ncbi:MAG: hypothetical protein Q8L08_00150 [Candidatus Nanopelagicaceae bacterium]|nr:hypothetical protein [Candidatus Nanopelagicaceae bacterium]
MPVMFHHPAGTDLLIQARELLSWMQDDKRKNLDSAVAAAMVHYQFEVLISVSPWFEARRADYYDSLLAVSSIGDWDQWINSLVSEFSSNLLRDE